MKVMHLLPALEQGGVETVVCDLNQVLVRAGWETVVVSKGGRLVKKVESAGGRHIALDLKSKNPFTYLTRAWKLRRILREETPDLVCVHSRVPAWLFVGANRPLRLPWISYAHGANSVSRYSEIMTKGRLVVTPSKFLKNYLQENYGTPEERFRIVPNAVDLERFSPERLDQAFIAEMRRTWKIAADDHVLMAVGRITPVKGLDALLDTVAEERKGNPHLKLVIVGGADKHHLDYLQSLKEKVRVLGLADAVVFAGPQEKVPECLSIADEVVSANTTKPETFGLSIVEAYAMGRPVRAKHFGGAAEVMDAVAAEKAPSLREAVSKLYGMERYAKETLAVYREAIEGTNRRV